ncbi:hypothetical protein [Moraxella lacunata]
MSLSSVIGGIDTCLRGCLGCKSRAGFMVLGVFTPNHLLNTE